LSGDRAAVVAEHAASCVSGALSMALENPMDWIIARPVVLITAAGLLGEQPLVDRRM
jgi:hypothetical protein